MRVLWLLLIVGLLIPQGGCDPELGEALDDVRSTAPGVCEEYCEGKKDCEWTGDGDLDDEAEESVYDQCLINCAWHADNGAYVVTQTETGLEYDEAISGSALKGLLDCLWEADLFDCTELGQQYYSWGIVAKDEDDCNALQECYDALDVSGLSEWVWTAEPAPGQCGFDGEPPYTYIQAAL